MADPEMTAIAERAATAPRRAVTIVALALVCLAGLFAGRALGAPPAPVTPVDATSIAWTGCGASLECARVRVPLDWDRPREGTITLAVMRHLASRPDRRVGSVFFNPGGTRLVGRGHAPRQRRACSTARCGAGSTSSAGTRAASARARRPVLRRHARRDPVLGRSRRAEHAGRFRALRAHRRSLRASLRHSQRHAAAAHLDGRHDPRPRPPAPAAGARPDSTTSAGRTAPSSARPTPTSGPAGCGRWCSTRSWTRTST